MTLRNNQKLYVMAWDQLRCSHGQGITDTVGTVIGCLFLPTGMLQATGTRPSHTHCYYFWYPSTPLCYLVLAGTAGKAFPWDVLYCFFIRILLESVPFNREYFLPEQREDIRDRVTHNILDLVVNRINTAPSLHSLTINLRLTKLVDCLFVGDCLGN
jgi:hypothetical protein